MKNIDRQDTTPKTAAKKMNLDSLLSNLKKWFDAYICRFDGDDAELRKNIDLKADHTRHVCENIKDIANSLSLARSHQDLIIAETAALLHDIGRFEQYQRYRTFADQKSEDHAALGVRIIRENRLLGGFDPESADVILQAVACHNRLALPRQAGARSLLILKLLRDADKVDIWRVVTDYYRNTSDSRNKAVELDLPDSDEYSEAVCQSLLRGELVRMTDLRTLNDFKLLQIGWIYDINFRRTFELVKENKYLEAIHDQLPQQIPEIDAAFARARAYLDQGINGV
ncbi:metal-dependent phosphohydrolase [Desulfosarcina ovata subsp. sediminis]|uniref:Metal-dependent phosphohydrolase n=1 Tax=Desulfosarcina ovata subsp. sediminis TaxID=885957 RepID=A0A5K7ZZU0_9BACT|nr:HD domain-containing protein [Desulfosarcina ovata]BBO85805.1 metal-dependent phosphohydrolase [Desulfosarcina ovata subsp. sediminis]